MPKVTGKLTDFGFDVLAGHDPRLVFRHNTPGLAGAAIMTTRGVEVIPEYNGYFETDLTASARIAPAGYYTVTLEWTDLPGKTRYSEEFPGRLYVPAEGGVLSDILRVPSNPALVWTGEEPPANPTPGTWWLDDEANLQERNEQGGWTFKQNLRGLPGYNAVGAAASQAAVADWIKATAGPNPVAAAVEAGTRAVVAAATANVARIDPITYDRPLQAATQIPSGRTVIGVFDAGWRLLAWGLYGIAQSDNAGTGWIARNVPAGVDTPYSGKASAVMFKGKIYLQALQSNGVPAIYRADPITGPGNFAWSGPLLQGAAGSSLFSLAFDADNRYIYWGEYGDPAGGPSAYRSEDGVSWQKMNTPGIGRHIHGIAADPYRPGHVYLTAGDSVGTTAWNQRSTDYGQTWQPLPNGMASNGAWQSCQISFSERFVYMAADAITHLTAFRFDRDTLKPEWITRESHRNLSVPGGLPSRRITDLVTTAGSYKVTSETARFTAADNGSRLRTIGQTFLPNDTYIRSIDSATQVTMWQPANNTGTGITAIFGGEEWGAATYYGAVDPRTEIFYFATVNGAFGGNVDGLFAVFPDGKISLLNILNAAPDSKLYIVPERNRLYVQGFMHSLLGDMPPIPAAN